MRAKLFGKTYRTKTHSRPRSSLREGERGWGPSSLELPQTSLEINVKNQSNAIEIKLEKSNLNGLKFWFSSFPLARLELVNGGIGQRR